MSSPWDPAIPQAMQRHGGSNRSIPKPAQPGAVLKEQSDSIAVLQEQSQEGFKPAAKVETHAA